MSNGKVVLVQKDQKNSPKTKLSKSWKEMRDLYPPTAWNIAANAARLIYVIWPVFLFVCHVVLGILAGLANGIETGLEVALKVYRRKWDITPKIEEPTPGNM